MKTPLVLLLALIVSVVQLANCAAEPKVYEYYAGSDIQSGLEALPDGFKLNGKNIQLYSGAIHYFRVHPAYWRDRLRKLRATGLVAVETYVPWNMHEPRPGFYDFGDGQEDMSIFLDIVQFIKIAQEEDLLVLLRPGPYICAEFEMGGLPSWLLNITDIQIRTSEQNYIDRVTKYYNKLLPLVTDLQFTRGGSIIGVQLENEFAAVGYDTPDKQYLQVLKDLLTSNGIQELPYTSDGQSGDRGSLDGVLKTRNFQNNPQSNLESLKTDQPDKPAMVMEFWSGWFDRWSEGSNHNSFNDDIYKTNLETVLAFPASFNLYMFHGGTNFGFLNGGNGGNSADSMFVTTSYDYGAPLSESGDYTNKYNITIDLVKKYSDVTFWVPERPAESDKKQYPKINIQSYLTLDTLYRNLQDKRVTSANVVNMESINFNNNVQSYGYTWYRKTNANIRSGSQLRVSGYVHDIVQVFVDGKIQTKPLESKDDLNGFGFWRLKDGTLILNDAGSTLDLIVENAGRVNYGYHTYNQKKGLYDGPVYLDDAELKDWEITAVEFKKNWLDRLTNELSWETYNSNNTSPALYRATLNIPEEQTQDTFIDMRNWKKGVVFVNNFNLGRYTLLGPQKTLYLPAPLLKQGDNTILVFESYSCPGEISFLDYAMLV